MSIAFVAATENVRLANNAVVGNKPAGVSPGDLMVAFIGSSGAVTTVPTGWTAIQAGALSAYWKYATAGDPSAWTWYLNAGSDNFAVIVAYSGVDQVSPIDTSAKVSGPGSYNLSAPGVTASGPGRMTAGWLQFQTGSAISFTVPPALAARMDTLNSRTGVNPNLVSLVADAPVSGAGATFVPSIETSASGAAANYYAVTVMLREGNNAPNAPSWVTPQNSVIPADQDAYLEIAFSDPDPGDSMSASNWKRWTLDGTGARVGSAVTTYQPTPSTQLLIPAGTLTAGTKYEFQADTLDSQGAEGPYGASLFVTAGTQPASPTFTDPIGGQTIGTDSYTGVISDPTVDSSEWTLYADNGSGGIDTATVLQGPVTVSTGDVRRTTFTGLANNVPVWWSVRVKYQGLWSQPTQIRTPVSYTPPSTPTFTLLPDVASGSLGVSISNPAGGAAVSYNDVYVDDGDGKGEIRKATNLAANATWTYWLPVSGRDYSTAIRVVAVATNGTTASS